MRGLRGSEDAPFERYVALFQDKVAQYGYIFFLDHAEGREVCYKDMICTDMHGWLLPEELESQFQPLFISHDEAQWDYDPFVYVDFDICNDKLSFIIEELEPIREFYAKAKEFCSFVTENVISCESSGSLIKMLMQLYITALELPEMSVLSSDEQELTQISPSNIILEEKLEPFYWEVFDPFVKEKPVCSHIAGDLSDIANDLFKGIAEYDSGRVHNAVFEWKLGLNCHWGCHLTDVLRALHRIRYEIKG